MEPMRSSASDELVGRPDLEELRVFVVAGDPLARAGLAALLAEQPGCTLAGQASSSADLPAQAAVYQPDVVLWDLGWDPAQDLEASLEQIDDLGEEGLSVVALLADDAQAPEVWASGARGLLFRNASVEPLLAALQAASQGLVVYEPSLAPGPSPSRDPSLSLAEDLTPRETEVLQLLADGLTNKAIAQRLGISDHTVKFHVNAVLGKLGAQSRTEAVVRATRLGLLHL
jgi:two-component system nitrate/nitrite response regulator NarL